MTAHLLTPQAFTPPSCLAAIAARYRAPLLPPLPATAALPLPDRGIVDRFELILAGNVMEESDREALASKGFHQVKFVEGRTVQRKDKQTGEMVDHAVPPRFKFGSESTGTTVKTGEEGITVSLNPSRLLFGRNDRAGEIPSADVGLIIDAMLVWIAPATLARMREGQAAPRGKPLASRFYPCLREIELAVDGWVPEGVEGTEVLRLYGALGKKAHARQRAGKATAVKVIGEEHAETVYFTAAKMKGKAGVKVKLYDKGVHVAACNPRVPVEMRVPRGRLLRFEITLIGPGVIRDAFVEAGLPLAELSEPVATAMSGIEPRWFVSGGGTSPRWSNVLTAPISYRQLHDIVTRYADQIDGSSLPIKPILDKDAHHPAVRTAKKQQTTEAEEDLRSVSRVKPANLATIVRGRGDERRARALWKGRNKLFGRDPVLEREQDDAVRGRYESPAITSLVGLLWPEDAINRHSEERVRRRRAPKKEKLIP